MTPLLMWSCLFVGLILIERRDFGDIAASPVTPTNAHRVILPALAGVAAFGLNALRRKLIPRGPLGWFLAFALVALLSAVWSDLPLYTSFRALELVIAVLVAWACVSLSGGGTRIVDYTLACYALILAAVLVGALILPGRALPAQPGALIPFRLEGLLPVMSATDVAHLAAVLAVYSMARLSIHSGKRFSIFWSLVLVSCIAIVVTAQSRTAIAEALVGTLAVGLATKRLGLLGALFLGAATSVVLFTETLTAYVLRGRGVDSLALVTGRTVYWQAALEAIRDRPILGYGYAYGTRGVVLDQYLELGQVSHIHNGVLDVLVGTGFVGLVLWVTAIGLTVAYILKRLRSMRGRDIYSVFGIGLIAMLLLRMLTTSTPVYHDFATLGFLAIAAVVSAPEARARERRPAGSSRQFLRAARFGAR